MTSPMVAHFIGRKFRKLKGKFTKKGCSIINEDPLILFSKIQQVSDRFLKDA